jgi:hypothetical protein
VVVAETCTAGETECRRSIVLVDGAVETALFSERDLGGCPNEFKCCCNFVSVGYRARAVGQRLVMWIG